VRRTLGGAMPLPAETTRVQMCDCGVLNEVRPA